MWAISWITGTLQTALNWPQPNCGEADLGAPPPQTFTDHETPQTATPPPFNTTPSQPMSTKSAAQSITSSTAQQQPTTRPAAPPQPPKPPTTVHPTALLGDSLSITGTHPVTISAGCVLHPRVKIFSFCGPVSLGEGVIVGMRSVLGVPPDQAEAVGLLADKRRKKNHGDEGDEDDDEGRNGVSVGKNTTVGSYVYISVASVGEATVIEDKVVVPPALDIGSHAKICAGITLLEDERGVADWEVEYGFGRRLVREGLGEGGQRLEEIRLKALERERVMLRGLLKRKA